MTELEIESKVDDICSPLFSLIQSEDQQPDTTCQIVYDLIGQITKLIVNKYKRTGQLDNS